jgi:hypothetical protein
MTNASLFASKTRLPALTADSVGDNPAAPTIAAITVSHPGSLATRQRPSSPARTVVSAKPPSWSANARALALSAITANRGANSRQSPTMLSTLVLAVRA